MASPVLNAPSIAEVKPGVPAATVPIVSGWGSKTVLAQLAGIIIGAAGQIQAVIDVLPFDPDITRLATAALGLLVNVATIYIKLRHTKTVTRGSLPVSVVMMAEAAAKAPVKR